MKPLGLLPLLFLPLSLSAQIAFVQVKTDSGSGTTRTAVFDSNNTAGNVIILYAHTHNARDVQSISDTLGNTYVEKVAKTCHPTRNRCGSLWIAENIAAGANTVTLTWSANETAGVLIVTEYSGLATSNSFDVTASADGNSTAPDSGNSPTTSQNDELIVGALTLDGLKTVTAGSTYTLRSPGFERAGLEDKVVSSSGQYNADFSLSAADEWVAIVATFKAAGGAARRLMLP